MSENEATCDEGPEQGPFSAALRDLANSMPDDPYRVDGVRAKARRLRNRRRATRATAGVVAGAAVIATLVAVRPGPAHVSTTPVSQPSTTIAEPSCAAAVAAAPTPVVVPPTPGADSSTASAAAKQAAAAAAKQTAANQGATGLLRAIKGQGTIVSATHSTVTITPDPQMSGQPARITATVSPTAEFYDGDTTVDARPPLRPGERVAYSATEAANGSYQLTYLGVHLPAQTDSTAQTVDPAVKAAIAAAPDPYVKASATVVSVQPGSLTVRLTDGQRAGQVVTAALAPNTVYIAGDHTCVDPVFTAGQDVGVLLTRDHSGAITALAVALSRPTAPRASRTATT